MTACRGARPASHRASRLLAAARAAPEAPPPSPSPSVDSGSASLYTNTAFRSENYRETYLSAEQAGSQAAARLPRADGDGRRPQRHQRPSRPRPQAPLGLGFLTLGPGSRSESPMRAALIRLKRRSDFLRTAAARHKAALPGLVLQVAPQPEAAEAPPRIGFTATRKVGNAVVRTRARRRLRAAAASLLPSHAKP